MSLQLPSNFAHDILTRETSLVPVVVIGTWDHASLTSWNEANNRAWVQSRLVLSTNQFNFNYSIGGSTYTQTVDPLLLNIPSLKESINIEKI